MRKVYRVETPCGRGLYRASDYANEHLYDTGYRHPMPYKDSRLTRECGVGYHDNPVGAGTDQFLWLFGFCSLEQLKFWIHDEKDRAAIDAEGLIVSVYESDTAKYGDTQAVFDPKNANKIDELRLIDI